jgi:hypothetical protein
MAWTATCRRAIFGVMTGGLRSEIMARLLLAAAIAVAGIALAHAQSAPHPKQGKPHVQRADPATPAAKTATKTAAKTAAKPLDKPVAKPAGDPALPKTVQLGEPLPQVRPPRPIAPQTPPPARSGRAFAQQGPVAVLPVPQTATAASVTIKPEMKSRAPLPSARPAANKPAAKPAQVKTDRRAALTAPQKRTGGR